MLARRKKKPRAIELLAAEGALEVSWNDGSESRYDLEALRRSCPCALCREARKAPEVAQDALNMLSDEAVAATGEARSFAYVGRYGIRIEWADGHDHGIYTFDFFRELDAA
jgi:DUF971 family protein